MEDLRLETKMNMLERNRLMGSLKNKLWTLKTDIQNLHEMCRKQGRTLEMEELSIHEMESSISLLKPANLKLLSHYQLS
ncbi:polyamine-modulated factor 1-binding protein 1-like isoform X2 [Petaurus breviceps papuanus]|uniref:polyamine-modulated factor 1-binding protein 1-like isoform X2 n=1 Tax=Petaurus breviceps papuanus TaxID=3040969 RepID=UPI0036D86248